MKNIEIKEFDAGSFADFNLTKMQINFADKMSLIQVGGAYIAENQKIIELDDKVLKITAKVRHYICLRYAELCKIQTIN